MSLSSFWKSVRSGLRLFLSLPLPWLGGVTAVWFLSIFSLERFDVPLYECSIKTPLKSTLYPIGDNLPQNTNFYTLSGAISGIITIFATERV